MGKFCIKSGIIAHSPQKARRSILGTYSWDNYSKSNLMMKFSIIVNVLWGIDMKHIKLFYIKIRCSEFGKFSLFMYMYPYTINPPSPTYHFSYFVSGLSSDYDDFHVEPENNIEDEKYIYLKKYNRTKKQDPQAKQ